MSKISHCDICQCDIKGALRAHEATKKHLANAGKGAEEPPKNEVKEVKKQHQMKAPPSMEELLSNGSQIDDDEDVGDEQTVADNESVFSVYSETFLADLENDHFGIEQQATDKQPNELNELKKLRTQTAIENEKKKLQRLAEQEQKNALKHKPDDVEELEILGKDRRVLIAKIQMYKTMFKEELKKTKIRIKPTATLVELKAILDELEAIVSIQGMEQFCLDVIYGAIGMLEGATTRLQNYDITGLQECLKANEQFSKLCRLLFIKYQSFSNVPPEAQLVCIVLVSSVACMRVNQAKKQNVRS